MQGANLAVPALSADQASGLPRGGETGGLCVGVRVDDLEVLEVGHANLRVGQLRPEFVDAVWGGLPSRELKFKAGRDAELVCRLNFEVVFVERRNRERRRIQRKGIVCGERELVDQLDTGNYVGKEDHAANVLDVGDVDFMWSVYAGEVDFARLSRKVVAVLDHLLVGEERLLKGFGDGSGGLLRKREDVIVDGGLVVCYDLLGDERLDDRASQELPEAGPNGDSGIAYSTGKPLVCDDNAELGTMGFAEFEDLLEDERVGDVLPDLGFP